MERGLGFVVQKITEVKSLLSGGDEQRGWRSLLEAYDVFSKLSATEESAIEFARLYLEFGELFMQLKDVSRAERCFRVALVLNPQSQSKDFIPGGQLAPKFDSPKAVETKPTPDGTKVTEGPPPALDRVPSQAERRAVAEERIPPKIEDDRAKLDDKKISESDKSEMRVHVLKTDIDDLSGRRDEILKTIRILNEEKSNLLKEKEQLHREIDQARKEYDTKFKKMVDDIKVRENEIAKKRMEIEAVEAGLTKRAADLESREKALAQTQGQMAGREAELRAVEFDIDDNAHDRRVEGHADSQEGGPVAQALQALT
jgi:tetratricopeptide (TPR) repeat protein